MIYTRIDLDRISRGSQILNKMWSEIEEFFKIVSGLATSELRELKHTEGGFEVRIPLRAALGSYHVVFHSEGVKVSDYTSSSPVSWRLDGTEKPTMEIVAMLYEELPKILNVVTEQLPRTKQQLEFIMRFANK